MCLQTISSGVLSSDGHLKPAFVCKLHVILKIVITMTIIMVIFRVEKFFLQSGSLKMIKSSDLLKRSLKGLSRIAVPYQVFTDVTNSYKILMFSIQDNLFFSCTLI